MANPYERFRTNLQTPANPYERFRKTPPEPQGPAPLDIDFNAPADQVRSAIAELPQERQREGWDRYADTIVAKERSVGLPQLPNPIHGVWPVGEWLDEAAAGINSIPHAVTGGQVGRSYEENLALERARQRAAAQEFPTLDTAGRIAGGFVGPASIMKGGGSVIGNMVRGAGVGGAGGAVAGAGASESDDPEDWADKGLETAKWTAAFGAGFPLGAAVGQRLVGAVKDAVTPAVKRLTSGAEAAADAVMAQKMKAAGITPDQIADDLAAGQAATQFRSSSANLPETIADTSHTMQRLTGSVYRAGGEAGDEVKGFLEARQRGPANRFDPQPGEMSGQMADIEDAVERALSIKSAKSAYKLDQSIAAKGKDASNKSYTKAYRESEGFDLQPALDGMALKAQQYSGEFRQKLLKAIDLFSDPMKPGSRWSVNNVARFDAAKKQLDDLIAASKKDHKATNLTRELTDFKHALLNRVHAYDKSGNATLNKAYQEARDEFPNAIEQREAIQLGKKSLQGEAEVTIDELRNLTPGQKKLARVGFLAALRNKYGSKKPGDNAALVLQDRRATEVLAVLAPKPQAVKLGEYLRRQDRMSQTRNVATGGSPTARNLEDDLDTAAKTMGTMWKRWRQSPGVINMVFEAVSSVAAKTLGHHQDTAAVLARRLLTTDPNEQRQILSALQKQFGPEKANEFFKGVHGVTATISQQVGGAVGGVDHPDPPRPPEQPAKPLPPQENTRAAGMMINPAAQLQGIQETIQGYTQNEVEERGNILPLGKYSDGEVRFAWPEITGVPGFERAREQLDTEGVPPPGDNEDNRRLSDNAALAAGGAMTGGLALTAAGRGVPENTVGAFGGRLFGRRPQAATTPQDEFSTLLTQIDEARALLGELRGQPPQTTSNVPATRPAANVPMQRQLDTKRLELDQINRQIDAERQRRAALPKHTSGVHGARDVVDRSAERAMLLEQFENAPNAGRPFKNRQGAMSMADQRKALNKQLEKNSPDDVLGTPSPWDETGKFRVGKGGRPVSFEDAIQAQIDAEAAAKQTKALITQKNKELAAAKKADNKAEVSKLKAELKAANKQVVELQRDVKFHRTIAEKWKRIVDLRKDD